MSDSNRVSLTGRLTTDPELRVLPSGRIRYFLCLEVHSRAPDPRTGEWAQRVQFLDTVAFSTVREISGNRLCAGARLTVDGSLDLRAWENDAGDCVHAATIIADTVQLEPEPRSLTNDRGEETPVQRRAAEPQAAAA